ncbi:hypothetical protein LTR86_007684 [Recurvomyces mirabilis]|nr:hypothetical protein LTR86_007684 [Recurvomyces mirabilis]
MRLINTTTLKLKEFFDKSIPEYAILSHRWGADEINHKDYVKGRFETRQQGYRKIKSCCDLAARRGRNYVWIDTCCIDKRSSAELSEAINSMYKWYEKAVECYVYLSDVQPYTESEDWQMQFSSSAWFQRGWTLQELLAPCITIFFANDWSLLGIGSVNDSVSDEIVRTAGGLPHLDSLVQSIVSIPRQVLDDSRMMTFFSVAQRLSWAANRQTTRVEDEAYCLLGILGVNMPLLYGEGDKAFRRLQLEVARQVADESILAFDRYTSDVRKHPIELLARSPQQFRTCGDMTPADLTFKLPFTFTNMGLELSSSRAPERNNYTPRKIMKVKGQREKILYLLACRHTFASEWHGYWLLLVLDVCGHYCLHAAGHDLVTTKDDDSRDRDAIFDAFAPMLNLQHPLTYMRHDLVEADLDDQPIHVHNPDQRCSVRGLWHL